MWISLFCCFVLMQNGQDGNPIGPAHPDGTVKSSTPPPRPSPSRARLTVDQLSAVLVKLNPEQLQFVDVAARVSCGSAGKPGTDAAGVSETDTVALARYLLQQDTEHRVGLTVPMPPSPPKPSNLDPKVTAAGVFQIDPATAAALRDFATKLVAAPSHTFEALQSLCRSSNPCLKALLEPLVKQK